MASKPKKKRPKLVVRKARIEMTINDRPAISMEISMDQRVVQSEFWARFTSMIQSAGQVVLDSSRHREDFSPMPPEPEEPGPEADQSAALLHLENKAKVHERMRERGLVFCYICGDNLTPS